MPQHIFEFASQIHYLLTDTVLPDKIKNPHFNLYNTLIMEGWYLYFIFTSTGQILSLQNIQCWRSIYPKD